MNDSKLMVKNAGLEDGVSVLAKLERSNTELLGRNGYIPFTQMLQTASAERLPSEVDALALAGWMKTPADRVVAGMPTEILLSLGLAAGNGPGAPIFQESKFVSDLFQGLQQFGHQFNAMRPALLASGLVSGEEAPELAVEGMELNINRVCPPWSGLHPHQDHLRFTASAQRIAEDSVAHAVIRARAFTVSGYARRRGIDGAFENDMGGALTFYVRPAARVGEDKAVHDVIQAAHNTGAAFFAHTRHGVARLIPGAFVRYSYQAFFPRRDKWEAIAERMMANAREGGRQ